MNEPTLSLKGISKSYGKDGKNLVTVLEDLSLSVREGEIVGLLAPSGAGKSTLLHIAGLLESPDKGQILLDGASMHKASDRLRTHMRRTKIGFVYQFHHLLPEFSALENVKLPQLANGTESSAAVSRATELLESVGLGSRSDHRPAELSGGEQQRAALCRALANRPRILLADEPTGNLDPGTAEQVFAAMSSLVRSTGLSALVATHNLDLAARMDRTVRLEGGKVAR